uniref:Uncharacterized protein n=1 Tax=Leptocylindrus danicus TaxID=163516 RepID=A0A7S2KJM9_9STRA
MRHQQLQLHAVLLLALIFQQCAAIQNSPICCMNMNNNLMVLLSAYVALIGVSVSAAGAWHHPSAFIIHHPFTKAAISSIQSKSTSSTENYAWNNNISQPNDKKEEDANHNCSIQSRARIETLRWVDNFVVPLKLCPWAAASMDAYHNNDTTTTSRSSVQIRMVDIPKKSKSSNAKEAHDILTEAVRIEAEGMCAMEEDHSSASLYEYNPNVAITFIVAVPEEETSDDDWTFHDFHTFHDSVVYMEEEYLPSIPIISQDGEDVEDEEDETLTLADRVAIAGFHPQWEYVSNDNDAASMEEVAQLNAISYEKRSPYPTVTIVHWSAIDNHDSKSSDDEEDLGSSTTMAQHITERIAEHNSEVLSKLGVDALEEIYVRDVLLDP